MARLYRPSIPLEIKCRIVLRQLGEMFIDDVLAAHDRGLGKLLSEKLAEFAETIKCEVSDLRLDHDPPLAARPQFRRGLGKKTYYQPDANDPEHLFYRPHGAQFSGSHDVKTRIRGDHGQYPDIVLIKRERRRQKAKMSKKSGLKSGFAQNRKSSVPGAKPRPGKRKWPSRPFPQRRK